MIEQTLNDTFPLTFNDIYRSSMMTDLAINLFLNTRAHELAALQLAAQYKSTRYTEQIDGKVKENEIYRNTALCLQHIFVSNEKKLVNSQIVSDFIFK